MSTETPDQAEALRRPSAAMASDKLFLGPEFLTWMFFHLETEGFAFDAEELTGGTVPTSPGDTVRFAIGRRVTLKAFDASGTRVTVAGPGLSESGEVLQAVRGGAMIDTLALEMAIADRVYSFSLRAADAGISGVKMTDLLEDMDEPEDAIVDPLEKGKPAKKKPKLGIEEALFLRMAGLDEVEAVLDALYARFLGRRLASAFADEDIASMRKTVKVGLAARLG